MSVEPFNEQFERPPTGFGRGLLSRRPGRREGLVLGLILTLAACLPVLVAKLPQMGDYAAHLARYHVMLDAGRSPFLAQYYSFQWKWTGNVGFDLLVGWLAPLMGLEPAGRVLCVAIPLLTGLSILTVEWNLRRRIGAGALLAMGLIWSPAMLMGFVNFGLSLAAALFAFALWVRLEGKSWRWAPFLPIGVIVWLCHVSGWGILGVLVFGYEWSRSKSWRAFVAPWPLLLPVWPLLFGGGTKGLLSYGAHFWTYKQAIWERAMRDQVFWLDQATPILIGLCFALALWRRKVDARLGWAVVLLVVATVLVPRRIVGGDYADYRLVATALLVACLAVEWRVPRAVLWLAALLALTRILLTTAGWYEASLQMQRLLTTLDHVPQGAKLANAVVIERARWQHDPYDHLAGYAVVRRDALTNINFAIPTIHMLKMREPWVDFVDPSQRLNHLAGRPIDLSRFKAARQADYLWYIGDLEPVALPPGATVIYRTPGSLLAKLGGPASPGPTGLAKPPGGG